MLKRFCVLFMSMMLAATMLVFTGCFGGGDSDLIDRYGNVTLRFWHIFPDGDPANPTMQALINEFQEENPHIRINHTGVSFWDYFTVIANSMRDERNGPHIFMQDNITTPARAEGRMILNLSQYMNDNTVNASHFMSEDVRSITFNDNIFAMPWSINGRFLYYNADHLNAAGEIPLGQPGSLAQFRRQDGTVRPPQTFAELNYYSIALTRVTRGTTTTVQQLGFDIAQGNNSLMNFVWPVGGTFFDGNGNPIVNSNAGVRQGFRNWYDVTRRIVPAGMNTGIDSGVGSPGNSYITLGVANGFTGNALDEEALFFNGQLSMMIATSEIPWKNQRLVQADRVNLGVAPIPYEGGEQNRWHHSGCFTLEVTGRFENPRLDRRIGQAAFDFVNFMMSHNVQSRLASLPGLDGWLPGRNSAYDYLIENEEDSIKSFILSEMSNRRYFDYIRGADRWWGDVTDEANAFAARNYATGRPDREDQLTHALSRAQNTIVTRIERNNR